MSASLTSDNGQSGCDKPTTSTAPAPFDDPKADLIIRSSDNIHFYVHKSLLSIVSPVFEGMLARPDDASQEPYDNRPCIPFSDDSRHLFCLLSWCDPRSMRPSPSLDNLTMSLEMAEKYDVDSIFAHAQKDLSAHDSVESEPFRAFAVAIRFRLDKVAQQAARATLRLSLANHSSTQLKHISAFALQNLHNYHFKFKKAVRIFLASDLWAEAMQAAARHLMGESKSHIHGPEYFSLKRLVITEGDTLWLPTKDTATWWYEYVAIMMHMLNQGPSGTSVPGPSAGVRKLIMLDRCGRCKNFGYEKLDKVSEYLASKIEEVVSKIPFVVKY